LAGIVLGGTGTTALAVGMPLLHGHRLAAATAAAVGILVAGLFMASDFGSPDAWTFHGPICFGVGTAISGVFMLILGALSGRLWRRFPDPAAFIAVGATAVGLLALHLRCGNDHPLHVVAFHVGPLLLLYLAARVLTRIRVRALESW